MVEGGRRVGGDSQVLREEIRLVCDRAGRAGGTANASRVLMHSEDDFYLLDLYRGGPGRAFRESRRARLAT